MARKSNTTISSAFLFEASSAQVWARFSAVISLAPVKFLAPNDFFDCSWYEITNRLAGGNSLSDFRGRNIDPAMYSCIRMIRSTRGAIKNNKTNQFFQFCESMPFSE